MTPKYSEYDNYRWINCNRWSVAKEVKALVNHLVRGIGSRKVGGYRINMTALVLDLYHSYLCDPEQYLAYSRDKTNYIKTGSDHPNIKNHNVTFDYMVKSIDHFISQGFVNNHPGGQFYNDETGIFSSYVSRMKATTKLMALVTECGVTPDLISTFNLEEDVVILRGAEVEKTRLYKGEEKKYKEKPLLKTPKNVITKRMTHIIRQYNLLLERSHIDVDIECLTNKDRNELVSKLADMDIAGTKCIVLRLSQKSVYRVFNNGSLEQGGRYYGAWWISAPSIVRKYITIQGETTVELDFSAMHIHLLYAKVGVNYADKKEDAYTLEIGPHSLKDKNDDRDFNKLILLTAYNAKSPEATASAVFDDLRKEHKLYKYHVHSHDPIKAKLDLLKKKHPLISDMVANDYGRELQYYDSCVVEKVIEHFTSKSIPVLTVHDSVICQAKHVERVRNIMLRFFYQEVDSLLKMKVSPTPKYSKAGYIMNLVTNGVPFKLSSGWFTTIQRLDPTFQSEYKGNIADTIANTLNIKLTSRSNSCSKKCRCNARLLYKLKFMPNIKLELREIVESYTNVLVIR